MEQVAIDATQLKGLRKARKIGRPKLGKMVGITERQVAKLEGTAAAEMAPALLLRISDALDVPPEAHTGEIALDPGTLEPASARTCTNGCCG